MRWSILEEGRRARFLAGVNDCAEALRFARLMAGRSTGGALGCVAGALSCAAVWSVCLVALGTDLGLWRWLGVLGAGGLVGSVLCGLLWSGSDRRWVKGVLVPEADRAGIRLGWLLAVLEGGGSSNRGDELASLRELAPTVRAELGAAGKVVDETGFAVGALAETDRQTR